MNIANPLRMPSDRLSNDNRRADMIVTGFYTSNQPYMGLADAFRRNLDAHGINHNLYAYDPRGDWHGNLAIKPEVALRAMQDFGDTHERIVQMDIDCTVRGDISNVEAYQADVAFHQRVKVSKRRMSTWPSSRVLVWRPGFYATALAQGWLKECENPKVKFDDEVALRIAISKVPMVSVSTLLPEHAAFELGREPDGATIVHQSAHSGDFSAFKRFKRSVIERIVGKPYREWKYGGDF